MTSDSNPPAGALHDSRTIRAMFGRIVPRYDAMNRIMTAGFDVRWRNQATRLAIGDRATAELCALDVATGTGDLAMTLARAGVGTVVGLDFAAPMIEVAAAKAAGADEVTRQRVHWVVGDALALPFPNRSFDACTVAFGIRNMTDYGAALREFARVLRPGGRFVCLELTPYRRPILGDLFNWYFTRAVPVIGGFLSGDRWAYQYLPRSVAAFPTAADFAALMLASGFESASYQLRGTGAVAIHIGIVAGPDYSSAT